MKKKHIIILIAGILVIGIGVTVALLLLNNGNSEELIIDPIDAEKYYKEHSNLVSITNATDSEDVTSEKDTVILLNDRGFKEYPVTTNYSIEGEYYESKTINESSSETHPIYTTYYLSANNVLWGVSLINGNITAYPVSYNLDKQLDKPFLIVESDTVVSYDSVSNKFFETEPDNSELILKKISRIDTSALDNYKLEENEND